MKHSVLFAIFSVVFLYCISISAQNLAPKKLTSLYYVDSEQGDDNNSGKNINSPWKSILKVNSTNFLPGDQILFKRGCTWYETLNVNSSGNVFRPVLYGAYGSPENPLPVIDAELIRNNCIYVYTQNYITIKDLHLRNGAGSGGIRIIYSSVVRVENCTFYVTGHGGIFIENSSKCVLSKNTITCPEADYDKQTDGIYSQRNSDNLYEKNNITLTNSNALQHIDGIQSYIDNNLTVRDNYIYQQNPKTNSQGIYATTGTGIHTYFNNVVNCPNTVASVMGFKNLAAGTATLRAYHNTLIGKGANIIAVNGDPTPEIKNNIFVALSPSHGVIRIDSTCINPSNINNNLYKNGGSTTYVTYKGVNQTFVQWQGLGFEAEGLVGDPMLQPDYTLSTGSPAINKGFEIGSICSVDKAGTVRPQMGVVDMGAFESFFTGKAEENILPAVFELCQNYPNPFNPVTRIRYTLPEQSEVSIRVYDLLGKEIAVLEDGIRSEGTHDVEFDGREFSSGVYIYRIKAGSFTETKKMTMIK